MDWPRYAPLPRRTACPFPGGEASKEKNMSLKRIFCNKGTLTNKFVGAFITKNSCVKRRSYIFFSFLAEREAPELMES